MTVFTFVRIARFVCVSVFLGAALVAILCAWGLSALALWLLRSRSRSVVLSPVVPLLLPSAPVRLCLPAAAPLTAVGRVGRFAAASAFEILRLQFCACGIGFAAASRVLVCPVRLALPAGGDFAGYDEWLDEREAVEQLLPFAGVGVRELRRLAVSRGVRGASRLRRAELVALLA
jgi:hypothetical protein